MKLYLRNLLWKIERMYLEWRFGKYSAAADMDPVHSWFELSYANYLTIPRSIMQSMPVTWQRRMVKCLEELDEHFEWRPKDGRYYVQLKGYKNGKFQFQKDPFANYRHAPKYSQKEVKEMRNR